MSKRIEKLSHDDCWVFLDNLSNRDDYGGFITQKEWNKYLHYKINELIETVNSLVDNMDRR